MKNKNLLGWLLIMILALIWGSSFILIKKSLIAFSWDQVATLRITASSLILLPLLPFHYKKINWKKYGWFIFAFGMLGTFIPSFLFPIAQTHIDSGMAGILNTITPFWVMIMGVLFFGVIVRKERILGVVIGLCGAVLLIVYGKGVEANSNNFYAIFIIFASICYGFSSNVVKKYLQEVPALTASVAVFILLAPLAVSYLLTTDFITTMQTHEHAWQSLGSIFTLALFSTVIGTILFIRLIQLTSAVVASMTTYFIPIVAILFGLMDGEVITIWHFIGMGLILLGVYLARERQIKT